MDKHIMKSNPLTLILAALLFTCQNVTGAENYKFRTMSPDGGFYYDGVSAIEQDADGFVWIMMSYELYRFDGMEYKKYYPYFAAISHSTKWLFNSMATDAKGNLYINTTDGVYRYHSASDNLDRIYDRVTTVKVDNANNVWFLNNFKWGLFNPEDNTLKEPLFDGESVSYMNPTLCMHNNDLYAFIHHRIYRYNPAKHEFTYCTALPHQDASVRYARAHHGKLWVYTNLYGLYKIDLSSFEVDEHHGLNPDIPPGAMKAFFVDRKENVWFATNNGLFILNPTTGIYTHYTHTETDPFSLPSNSIWTINEDRQGNVWVGTYSGKICYANIYEGDAFRNYTPQNSKLNQVPVSALAESKNYLWVGTEGKGINRIDKLTGDFWYLSNDNELSSNNIKSLLVDKKENVWISMYQGGLNYYDTQQNRVHTYKREPGNPKSLLVNDIRKIIPENDSGLWIAYQHYKPVISYFAIPQNEFTHITLNESADSEFIFDIIKQGEKNIWAITNEHLYKLDLETYEIETLTPKDSTYMGLFTFCPDDSGNIWIGTIGNGLLKFNPNTATFTPLNESLPNTIYSVYNICYDKGNIWMGTDNGLFCYNIKNNTLRNFDKKEGTQGQVYYPLAVMKGKEGKLYFGGTEGFTIVDPQKITQNKYQPNVIISDFLVNHKSTHYTYSQTDSVNEIVLDYDQTNFGFKFSSDNYHIPEKNLFKYRLKGYDEQWIETTADNRTAMYVKVPAGTYHFEVLTANNDGVWGDTPAVIRVVRKPAPWRSWYAYILYSLLFISITYTIIRYYVDKKQLKMQLYLDAIEKDKQDQIHQAQLRFFTNISHDFRTPLSLIIAALDKLRKEGLKEYYYRILNGNAQRLLNLVNELMDFRTVENGKMKLSLEPLNANSFIKTIAADFTDYAGQRNINFKVICDSQLPENIYLDKNILEKVVMNLINNAFKYSPDKGTITIETRSGSEKHTSRYNSSYTIGATGDVLPYETFSIIVSDTGVGISKESISSVFERFYKVNTVNTDSHLGTGIGLALVKSMVLLHKGSITIYSERNEGTDIIIQLPVGRAVYNESDFKTDCQEEEKYPAETNNEVTDQEEKEANEGAITPHKKRILIAEDNYDLRRLIVESLSDDFNVFQAPDGLEAAKLIEEIEFDIIISDIMMPHKDGVSLCNDIKKDISTSHIPFILLTAKTSMESKIEGVDSGADLYFEKPIDLDYLRLSIHNIFRNQQQLKDHYARNYYADSSELSTNEQDNKFLKHFTNFIDQNLDKSEMDVGLIANELSMSRSKLYSKVKSLTGKSVVEFVLNYRLRKAAKLIIQGNKTMKEITMLIGIESPAYFTNSFKKLFGETPTAFAAKHRKEGGKESEKGRG